MGLLKSENFYKNNKCSLLFLLDSRFRGNDEIGGFQQPLNVNLGTLSLNLLLIKSMKIQAVIP